MENRKIKILAIDDNLDNLVILKALIMDAFFGAEVFLAQSGQKGIEIGESEDPDIILLDVIMPGMDGFEVCKRLKSDIKLRDIPVVFITALKGDRDNRVKALDCGAEAFLSKPVDISELTAQIRAMLKIRDINKLKRNEKEVLAALVEEKTKELKESNRKTIQLLEAVKQSEERFQLLFNKAPLGYQSLDIDGRFIEVNQKWIDTLGYAKNEVIGKWFGDFLCPEYVEGFRQRFPIFKSQGFIHSEFEMLSKDGQRLFIAFDGKIGYSDSGDFKQTHCILQDVTEQRKAEKALLESEERYRQLSEQTRTFTWEVDENGLYTFVDHVSEKVLGYHPEELIQKKHFYDLCPEEEREDLKQTAFDIIRRKGLFRDLENKAQTKTGEIVVLSTNGFPLYYDDGKLKGYRGNDTDITVRKQAEEAFRRIEERFRVAQEISPDGFTILHPVRNENGEVVDFTFVYENQAVARFNQTDAKEVVGKRLLELFPAHSGTTIFETYKYVASTGKTQVLDEVNVGEVVSKPIWLRLVVTSMGEDIAIAAQDITNRKNTESELLYLSFHDHLTGVYNRRFFEEKLKSLDTKQNLPLSIIMSDVNGLKMVNDSFGHDSGDMLLIKAADTIRNACREDDIIARIGGDEFIIILPKTSAEEAVKIANRIKELAQNIKVANVDLSISYGHDTKVIDKQSIVEVIANAENHMYRHKLYERSSIRSKTIDLIMNALFEKSSREAMHSRRVSGFCVAIANKMNLSKDATNQLKIAGLIHDIGKIGVEEKILNKPGKLDADERRDIERHPEIGWRLLSSTDDFSELAQFVLNHHEKWDGSGYPNGLKGNAIPLESRIIAVADAFDAMTSKRSYKNEMGIDEAVNELKICSGTQFDPDIVEVFIKQVLVDEIETRPGKSLFSKISKNRTTGDNES